MRLHWHAVLTGIFQGAPQLVGVCRCLEMGEWWSGRHILGGSHRPQCYSQRYPDHCEVLGWNSQSDYQTSSWWNGSWFPPGAGQCPDSCGQSLQTVAGWQKHWRQWQVLLFPWPKSNWASVGHNILMCLRLPSPTKDCPGAQWCPEPDLKGHPPGLLKGFSRRELDFLLFLNTFLLPSKNLLQF